MCIFNTSYIFNIVRRTMYTMYPIRHMSYIYVVHICRTYMSYIYVVHICRTYMSYNQLLIQSRWFTYMISITRLHYSMVTITADEYTYSMI